MTDDDRKKEEERRKKREKERQQSRLRATQELTHRRKYRSLHDKHKDRRKKDCMIGMPFVIAYQGDPAQNFFCNDIHTYDLIFGEKNFARLERYLAHHVVTMHEKVLIFEAGPDHQCPACGIGYIKKFGDGSLRCEYCGYRPDKQ